MSIVQARELLDDPHHCGQLTMEGFHKLLLRAGYPTDAAHEAAKQHGWYRLEAGKVM